MGGLGLRTQDSGRVGQRQTELISDTRNVATNAVTTTITSTLKSSHLASRSFTAVPSHKALVFNSLAYRASSTTYVA